MTKGSLVGWSPSHRFASQLATVYAVWAVLYQRQVVSPSVTPHECDSAHDHDACTLKPAVMNPLASLPVETVNPTEMLKVVVEPVPHVSAVPQFWFSWFTYHQRMTFRLV